MCKPRKSQKLVSVRCATCAHESMVPRRMVGKRCTQYYEPYKGMHFANGNWDSGVPIVPEPVKPVRCEGKLVQRS